MMDAMARAREQVANVIPINPRSIREEGGLLEALTDELRGDLIDALRARGCSNEVVVGMLGWCDVKKARRRDESSSTRRADYRRILRELAEDPTTPARLRRVIPGYLKSVA